MELARGIEPPTVAGSAQNRASPAPAKGAGPLACSPRMGHIPFETPRLKVQLLWSWREELNLQPAVYKNQLSQFLQIWKTLIRWMKALMGAGSSVSWLLHPIALGVR